MSISTLPGKKGCGALVLLLIVLGGWTLSRSVAGAACVTQVAEQGLFLPEKDFEGWLVLYQGQQYAFPVEDKWTASPAQHSFTMKRGSDFVSYYGTFQAMQVRSSAADVHANRSPKVWWVTQDGVTQTYPRADGWTLDTNVTGLEVTRKSNKIWYYGAVQVEYGSTD
jgi:hypothetical protein